MKKLGVFAESARRVARFQRVAQVGRNTNTKTKGDDSIRLPSKAEGPMHTNHTSNKQTSSRYGSIKFENNETAPFVESAKNSTDNFNNSYSLEDAPAHVEKSDILTDSKSVYKDGNLSEDAFSLLYMESGETSSILVNCYVFTVFFIQFLVLVVVAADLFNYEDDKHWPNPPADVSIELRISQYFAIALAVFMEENITTSLSMLLHILFDNKLDVHHNVPKRIILIGSCGKFLIGYFSLFISLIIAIQSSKVIDLFANFAGMYFIGSVDNIFFQLVDDGYFGETLENRAEYVKDKRLPHHRGYSGVVLFFILSTMMGVCGWINCVQSSGELFTHSITVHLGDEIMYWPSLLNGEYEWKNGYRVGGRPVYVEARCSNTLGESECGIISFCLNTRTWTWSTFDYHSDSNNYEKLIHEASCTKYFVISPRTDAFDVMEVPATEWSMISQPSGVELPVPTFTITSSDCKSRDDCSGAGSCNTASKKCICDEERFGLNCEAQKPCKRIVIDPRGPGLVGFPDKYEILLDEMNNIVTTNNGRPVYINFEAAGYFNLILFGGYRWIIMRSLQLPSFKGSSTLDLISYIKKFHANNELHASFVSEPSRGYSPAGLDWNKWLSRTAKNNERKNGSLGTVESVDAFLINAFCTIDDDCGNGRCDESTTDKVCVCNRGFFGVQCQMHLIEGKINLFLDHGNSISKPCAFCEDIDFWFFDPIDDVSQSNSLRHNIFCAPFPSASPIYLTDLNVPRRLAFYMNSTHFLIYTSTDERQFQSHSDEEQSYYLDQPGICARGKLINAIERHPSGKIIHYEEMVEVTATDAILQAGSVDCNGSFSLGANECLIEDFSVYSKQYHVDRFFVRINVKIAGQLTNQR